MFNRLLDTILFLLAAPHRRPVTFQRPAAKPVEAPIAEPAARPLPQPARARARVAA